MLIQVDDWLLRALEIDSLPESETGGLCGFPEIVSEYPIIDSPFYHDFGGAQMFDASSPIDDDISVSEFLNGVLKDDPDEQLYDDTTSQENSAACFIISAPDGIPQSGPTEHRPIIDSVSNGSDVEGMLIGAGQVSLYIVVLNHSNSLI